ncbi:hypothetical protein ACEQ8H_002172 [Pleosporales sp. CAS-2024a]
MGVLSGIVIAITGTLPAEPSQIRKWVEANGGRWSARVDAHVTHLIASRPAWKSVTDPVMKAAELNMHIVSYDWLEDSLQSRRRLAEKKYTWESIKETKQRRKEVKKLGKLADSKKFEEGCRSIYELTGSGTLQKLPPKRKPKPSKSHFFGATLKTQLVSAKDALLQRRAAREAAEAEEKARKAAKKATATASASASTSGTAQAPIMMDDETPELASVSALPRPPPSAPRATTALTCTSPCTKATFAEPQAKTLSLKDLYHFYLDSTGFEYNVTLVRSNFATNQITRYQISILESHTMPHTYCTLVQYVPPPPPALPTREASADPKLSNPLLAFLRPAAPPRLLPDATEQTRLRSLITPPVPTASQPYKQLICPMNSAFPPAWRAFRHTFRTLTHLAWEERFDLPATTTKAMQTARALALNIEPYLYAKPKPGMPLGHIVQEAGLLQGNTRVLEDVRFHSDREDGYARNEFGLPGTDEPLGRNGVVGAGIWRREDEARKRERRRDESLHAGLGGGEDAVRRREGAPIFTTLPQKQRPFWRDRQ